jgi:hypothetical protein
MKLSLPKFIALSVLAAFLIAGALLSVYYLLPAAFTDYRTLKARSEVERMRDGKKLMPALSEWDHLRGQLVRAAGDESGNAQLLDDIAFLYVFRALSMDDVPELADLRQSLFREAVGYYRPAAKLRPMFPYGWANLALAKHSAGENDAELWAAFDRALAYGRNEPPVQRMLAEVAFANWATLDPQRAEAITTMVTEAPEKLQQPLLDLAEHFVVTLPISLELRPSPAPEPRP